uniref:Putative mitochondrial atp synthase coupling factor 6 n=1 Tax=Ixodes ricinus TaxID=34613 RepID=A0A6B0UM99_IXORI
MAAPCHQLLLSLFQTRVFSSPENMALNGKLHALATQCITHCRRNYGISAVLMQKSLDPVQKLFVDKLREYAQKSKSKSELFVDADEKIKMEYNDELKKSSRPVWWRQGFRHDQVSRFPV